MCTEKCWEFQTTSPLEPLGHCCSNFIWSLPGAREWKIATMVAVRWPRWPPCPYMVKQQQQTLKIFSRSKDALWLNLCIIYQGREVYRNCFSNGRTLTFDLFYGEVKFAYLCTCMGKMFRISNDVSFQVSGPMLLKFHLEPPPWGRGMKDC